MSHDHADAPAPNYDELKVSGYLAEFDNVDDLMHACEKVRDAGYTKWDAHTPFPVHGIEDAMGVKMTILPWIVLGGGLTGLAIAIGLQWWCNAIDYPFLISGKPYWSIPASVPIYFELTVLLSAITTFFSILLLNWLPAFYHPLFRSERFKRATDDRFFIAIDEADPLFHRKRTKELLETVSKLSVDEVMDHVRRPPFPTAILFTLIVLATATFIPLAIAVRARYSTSTEPRINLIWDMDYQPKYKAQRASMLFEDGRATRPQVDGTVAVSDVVEDEDIRFNTGKTLKGDWLTEIPAAAGDLTALMDRGRDRFTIYCTPCHGIAGDGKGAVGVRAMELQTQGKAKWVQKSYHDDLIRIQSIAEIFGTITNGKATMPSYKGQLPNARDRWAIALYVRALQQSQYTEAKDLTPDDRAKIGAIK